MARNSIPTTLSSLLAKVGEAADGAHIHETAIGLQQNTEARLRSDCQALAAAALAYDTGKAARSRRTGLRSEQSDLTRVLLVQIVDALRPQLGRDWNPAWQAAGFTARTLAIPSAQPDRLGLLTRLEGYFLQNPGHEIAGMGATAVNCAARRTAMAAACTAADQAEFDAAAARTMRDNAAEALHRRMRSLLDELRLLMGAEDPRWHAFGLNSPADPETPEAPEVTTVTAGVAGSQILMIGWSHAARAERYRVMVQIPGQTEPLLVQTAEDPQATVNLSGLALSGAPVEVFLSGVNEAGTSALSQKRLATVP